MDIGYLLANRLFIPVYQRRWGLHEPGLLDALTASAYLSESEIRDIQWSRLRELVIFVSRRSPFYRRRFQDAGFEPGDLKTWDDFAQLPVLTKADLRNHREDLISEGCSPDSLFYKRTGGSTGEPVHLYWDDAARRFKNAVVRRHNSWAGAEPGMKAAALWGDTEKSVSWRTRVYRRLCERTVYLDTLKMDDEHLRAFVAELLRFRPQLLFGHAHSLYFFTQYLVASGSPRLPIQAIISTAESLAPGPRRVIEEYFGRILFDRYGCEEVSLIASECEAHDGLHMSAEGLYVELPSSDPSIPAPVIVSDLTNRSMPLLRYEVGDLAIPADGPCDCGRGLPRLQRVYGRTSDILYAPDGRRISGISILDTFLIHIPGVKQAQIVQDAIDHVLVRVVAEPSYSSESESKLRRAILDIFGSAMTYDIVKVPRIQPTRRGKFQFTICQIDPPMNQPTSRPSGS